MAEIQAKPNLELKNYLEFPNQDVVLQKPLVLKTFVKEAKISQDSSSAAQHRMAAEPVLSFNLLSMFTTSRNS